MYVIDRAAKVAANEHPEDYHIFTEDSSFAYQLFLWTKEELRGKNFPPRKKEGPGTRSKTRSKA